MSIDARSRYAAAGFVALLLLSVFWPAPIVSVNRLWLHRDLGIDELSFLGREARSWDAVFWCIAGLFAIAVVQSAATEPLRVSELRGFRVTLPRRFTVALAGAIALIALTWLTADRSIVAFAERIQSETIEDWIRILNRLGGGMNPVMIVLFFIVAGVAYRRQRWLAYGVAMAVAGLSAGLIAHALKFLVGRTRPELWLGPFHYGRATAYSFPSGHTVAAFALGGVLLFGSRSIPLRIIALMLACAVALARVLAFRHWPSDVVASALIALLAAWIAHASTSAKFTDTSVEQPASSIVTP
ncbi:MAG TPA: phosphatase PAP2 family protein [Thermoanaerobaculia bacterium]|jgi:undecaprenyl-diphosphatase